MLRGGEWQLVYRGSQDLRSTQRREDFQAFGGIRSFDDLNSQSPW
jgi:hypothetical protein